MIIKLLHILKKHYKLISIFSLFLFFSYTPTTSASAWVTYNGCGAGTPPVINWDDYDGPQWGYVNISLDGFAGGNGNSSYYNKVFDYYQHQMTAPDDFYLYAEADYPNAQHWDEPMPAFNVGQTYWLMIYYGDTHNGDFQGSFVYSPPDCPQPVDCVGSWGACSVGSQTYSISVNAANGGASCPYSNGATQSCGTGASWSGWGSCSAGSQSGTCTEASGGGAPTCSTLGYSAGTNTQACTPSTPTGFVASPSTCGNNWLNLSWNASGGATTYNVYRSGVLIYTGSALAFSDTGRTLGSTYSYTITASNSGGTSAAASASGTTAAACSYALTINKAGAGDGSTTGAGTYDSGTVVTATASANAGSSFTGWAVDCNSSGQVTMTGSKTCTAVFAAIPAPNTPDVSGSSTGYASTNYTYTFVATDPSNWSIRYGVDWDMDGSVATTDWFPSPPQPPVTYISSGVTQSTSHSWSTAGVKTFQVLAQNIQGVNSSWRSYTVTLSNSPVTGVCGTANKTYAKETTSYGGDTYCSAGTQSSSPAFPGTMGTSVTWTCDGQYGGGDSPLCTAIRAANTHTVTAVPPTQGGSIIAQDNGISCGYTCAYDYNENSTMSFEAVPDSTYWEFTGWTGDCAGITSPICTININASKNIGATFILRRFNYQEF